MDRVCSFFSLPLSLSLLRKNLYGFYFFGGCWFTIFFVLQGRLRLIDSLRMTVYDSGGGGLCRRLIGRGS